MESYNQDEILEYLELADEKKRNAFICVLEQLRHPTAEYILESKQDCIIRSNFLTLNSGDLISIQMAYWLVNGELTMEIHQVAFYDDLKQMQLYKSMEETRSTFPSNSSTPQMN